MEWTRVTLAKAFASRGFHVDLVIDWPEGAYVDRILDILRVVALPEGPYVGERSILASNRQLIAI